MAAAWSWCGSVSCAALLLAAGCARDWSLPPRSVGPVIEEIVPASAFAGERVALVGQRLAGPGLGEPHVLFAWGGSAAVVLVRPDRVEVLVPRDAGSGPVTVRTRAGEARTPTDFTDLGPGRLRPDPFVNTTSVNLPFELVGLTASPHRVSVALWGLDLLSVLDRSTGEVRWLTTPRLQAVEEAPDGALWMMGGYGLMRIGLDGEVGPPIALAARGSRLGLAPDGSWACVVSSPPFAVGIVELGARLARPPVALAEPLQFAGTVAARPGPPRGCLFQFDSAADPAEALVVELREGPGGLERAHTFRFPGSIAFGRLSLAENAFYFPLFGDQRTLVRLDLGSGEWQSLAVPSLRMSGLVLGPGEDRLLLADRAVGQLTEIERPSLVPRRAFSLGGAPWLLAASEETSEVVAVDAAPLRLLFADGRTGARLGERPLEVRTAALSNNSLENFLVAPAGSAAMVGFGAKSYQYVKNFVLRAPGAIRMLAANIPGGEAYAASAGDGPDGPVLSLFQISTNEEGLLTPGARFDASLPGPARGLATAECTPPRPCPFGTAGALFATAEGTDALYWAPLSDATSDRPWLREAALGLGGPGACAAALAGPLVAVGEARPPGVAVIEVAQDLTVRARTPLPAEPSVLAWAGRTRRLLALAGGRLWRIGDEATDLVELPLPWPARALVVSPDGREAYLASPAEAEIAAVELSTGRIETLKVPAGVEALSLSGGGGTLLGIRADRGTLFAVE